MATDDERPSIPVHVGAEAPRVYEDLRDEAERLDRAGEPYNREYMLRRPQISRDLDEVDPDTLGLEFRWIGEQTDDCVAAIEPGRLSSGGAKEFERLRRGAVARGEPALVIKTLDPDAGRRIFGATAGVWLAGVTGISGDPVGSGARPSVVGEADAADVDLAKRVLGARESSGQWWALSLSGETWIRGDGSGSEHQPPVGTLQPLLVSNLGEAVMAVWTPPEGDLRIYVLPPGHDWSSTLRWLVEQGLPAHAPNAMRALRSEHADVPDALLSRGEKAGLEALRALDAEHAAHRRVALATLTAAKASAEAVRDPLLFAQGQALANAVGQVFRSAGAEVADLDEDLGDSISADLLVQFGGKRVLIEVKSSQGAAAEDLMSKLVKHLQTWPKLRPEIEVKRGLLVVSHDLRKRPEQRAAQPYQRREFVESAPHPVVSTRQLLDWWLEEDWASIRDLVTGDHIGSNGPETGDTAMRAERVRRRPRWRRK